MQDVVFTGPAPRKVTRQLMIAAATHVGIKARTSFCSKTRTVVAPHDWIKSGKLTSKIRKAIENGAEVVPYHRFIAEQGLADLVL